MKKATVWMAVLIFSLGGSAAVSEVWGNGNSYLQQPRPAENHTEQAVQEEDPFTGRRLVRKKETDYSHPLSRIDFNSLVKRARPESYAAHGRTSPAVTQPGGPVAEAPGRAYHEPAVHTGAGPSPAEPKVIPAENRRQEVFRTSYAVVQKAGAAEKVKVWAVVAGVSDYAFLPSLQYSDDDAWRIYSFLKSPAGGALKEEQIRLLVNGSATRDRILQALREIFGQAGPDDMVVFYFSGHGLPGVFLTYDYGRYHQRITQAEVDYLFAGSRARYKLFIADACYAGSLAPGIDTAWSRTRGGMTMLLSSRPQETSLECRTLQQGVFSHFLLLGLQGEADRNRDGAVTVQELFDFTCRRVRTYTNGQQTPVICFGSGRDWERGTSL